MKIYLSAAENAIHHYADWNGWNWSLALIAYIVLVIAAVGATWFLAETGWVGPTVAGLTAFVAFLLHGNISRHIAGPPSLILWLLVPLVLAGICAAASWNTYGTPLVVWISGGLFAWSFVWNALSEWLTRLASGIPTSVGALLLVGVIVVVAMITQANRA